MAQSGQRGMSDETIKALQAEAMGKLRPVAELGEYGATVLAVALLCEVILELRRLREDLRSA